MSFPVPLGLFEEPGLEEGIKPEMALSCAVSRNELPPSFATGKTLNPDEESKVEFWLSPIKDNMLSSAMMESVIVLGKGSGIPELEEGLSF